MNETLRWALPLLAAGQAQKEVTHNESILAIDRLLHLAVVSRSEAEPPIGPRLGDTYIIGPAALGLWSGLAGQLAMWDGVGWTITPLRQGCLAWVEDEQAFAVLMAGGWAAAGWPAR
jgi:hypothetical protein